MKLGYTKIALSTPKVVVGGVEKNLAEIKQAIKNSAKENAEMIVFGKNVIAGFSSSIMQNYMPMLNACKSALEDLVKFSKLYPQLIVVGLPLKISNTVDSVATVISSGKIIAVIPKNKPSIESIELLGTKYTLNPDTLITVNMVGSTQLSYNLGCVFDEDFNEIVPSSQNLVLNGADLIINLASSNTVMYSHDRRVEQIRATSTRLNCGYIYVSSGSGEPINVGVPSNDKIVTEPEWIVSSLWMSSPNKYAVEDEAFVIEELDIENILSRKLLYPTHQNKNQIGEPKFNAIVELKSNELLPSIFVKQYVVKYPFIPIGSPELERVLNILGRGILQRLQAAKTEKVIIGTSGGLDSTMVLLIVERIFRENNIDTKNILAVMLPSGVSSSRTKNNAKKLIELLGVSGFEFPIGKAVEQHLKNINHENQNDVVYENAQARERTQILLSLANKHNALMLGTSDMSEIALGFSTYGGDQVSHFNPNANVPKTMIKKLISYMDGMNGYIATKEGRSTTASEKELSKILRDILDTPISPELLEHQDTEKILGPYELHDFFIYNLIGRGFSVEKVYALAQLTFPEYKKELILSTLKTFISRFFTNQFKKNASSDGISIHEFDLSNKNLHTEFSAEVYLKAVEKLV
ncbi:MAG: NAD(+) synthase [Firmicutes bacterium]|nr:NAD(+) synthase [Bacillota bacterium]